VHQRRRTSGRAHSTFVGAFVKITVALSLAAAGVTVAAPAEAQSYQRGPNPTSAVLEASRGPFATQEMAAQNVSGFGGGRIYYPTSTAEGTFGAVAIAPGFISGWGMLSWMGHRIASHGFIVIGFETNSGLDFPASRGQQALAALDNLTRDSRLQGRIDPTRLAAAGWSMGGGAMRESAIRRPSLKAVVPIAPWELNTNWTGVRVPTAVFGGQGDIVASETSMAEPMYTSVNAEKIYLEVSGGGHFFPTGENDPLAKHMVSFLKRYVDNDTRYDQFLCPGPGTGLFTGVSEYRSTCPLT
jgi:dienelactone hydrolase